MAWDTFNRQSFRTAASVLGKPLLQYKTTDGVLVDLFDPVTKTPRAFFLSEAKDVTTQMEAPSRSSGLRCEVLLEDLPVDPEDDLGQIIDGANVYDVVKTDPDGEGGSVLTLKRSFG